MSHRFILYIDDNPNHLDVVQATLETHLPGVVVEVCCTSRGAEAMLNTRCYDVIISDVALPGELGTDIAEKILELDPGQPIYLLSEYTGEKFEIEAARIGLPLHKKFSQRDPAEFVADIKTLLDQRPCPPGELGKAAATREMRAPHGESAEEISRPAKPIRLTSPHIAAARAADGRTA